MKRRSAFEAHGREAVSGDAFSGATDRAFGSLETVHMAIASTKVAITHVLFGHANAPFQFTAVQEGKVRRLKRVGLAHRWRRFLTVDHHRLNWTAWNCRPH